MRITVFFFGFLLSFWGAADVCAGAADKPFIGQWIWSPVDKEVFFQSRERIPQVVPSIWISTLSVSHNRFVQRLALSPSIARSVRPAAFIVRFDDSIHGFWDNNSAEGVAREVDSALARLMNLLRNADISVEEVQLDYDCPIRRLEAWAHVIRVVSSSSLKGKRIWITSIPAHLEHPQYSYLFQGVAEGHILQLFDTGLSANQRTFDALSRRLRSQTIPFRVGLGAFERKRKTGPTDHRVWFSSITMFQGIPGFRGIWIFPGGNKWLHLHS